MVTSSVADPGLSSSLPPAQVAKLRAAAQDFAAMALGQLLQPMFATTDMSRTAFGGGAAEAAIQPMLVDALAKNIAAHGGLGLAAPVFASMLRSQEAANQAAQGTPAGRQAAGRQAMTGGRR